MENQRTQLAKIYQNQSQKNKELDEFRLQLITQMYRSLCENEDYTKKVMKLVHIRLNKNLPINERCVKASLQFYKKIKQRKQCDVPGYGLVVGSIMFAYLIHKSNMNEKLKSLIYEDSRKELGKTKEAYILSDVQANRLDGKYFYLCSSHADSAEDHKDYQGKLYIDENCTDPKVLEYVRKYNIKSYQWVTGAPVYMITRPNCRHYFKVLDTNEVLSNTKSDLIKKYDLHRKIGDRSVMQTLQTRGQKVEIVIKSYQERLRLHQEMDKIRPNDFIKSAIKKDTMLINKWKKAL